MEDMLILLSNDDGIEADGIRHLEDVLKNMGEVVVVAPTTQMSASSHAVTLKKPLYVKKISRNKYSVSGTPADCVITGLFYLLNREPDLVLSGINLGQNLGEDVFYSGTVAAAREGALYGIRSAAFSLVVGNGDEKANFDSASQIAKDIVNNILVNMPEGILLNVNIPNLPYNKIKGLRITKLSSRRYVDVVKREKDFIVIGGRPVWNMEEGTDIISVREGYVSITPLLKDLTDYGKKRELERVIRQVD